MVRVFGYRRTGVTPAKGIEEMQQTSLMNSAGWTAGAKPGDKIKELGELAVILQSHQASGRKVVLCHGVFDLLHIGHIRHFEQAKRNGDVLVVTLTADQYVNKG